MISGMFYITALWLGGEVLSAALSLPIPGSVLGMVMLTLCLNQGWIALGSVESAADVLVDNLALLFVPPGVGLMLYFDLIGEQWLALGLPWLVSTFAVLGTVGWLEQRLGHGVR